MSSRSMIAFERLSRPRVFIGSMFLLQTVWYVIWGMVQQHTPSQRVPVLVGLTALCGLFVSRPPAFVQSRLRDAIVPRLGNDRFFLWSLAAVFSVIAIIHLPHTGWNSDERDMFNASRIVAEQGVRHFFAHYAEFEWLGRQHPPLAPLLLGGAMSVFGTNAWVFHLTGLPFAWASVWLTYRIGRQLMEPVAGWFGALLFCSFPCFFRIVFEVTNDVFFLFFFTLAIHLVIHWLRTPTYRLSGMIGVVVGAGLLTKYTMALIYLLLLGLAIHPILQKRWPGVRILCFQPQPDLDVKTRLKHWGLVVLVSAGLLAAWLIYADKIGALSVQARTLTWYSQVSAVQARRLVHHATGADQGRPWWRNMGLLSLWWRLPAAVGFYNLPLFVWGGRRGLRPREASDWLMCLWIVSVAVPVLLTLPVDRYFLPAFPALALLLAPRRDQIPAFGRALAFALSCSIGQVYLYLNGT